MSNKNKKHKQKKGKAAVRRDVILNAMHVFLISYVMLDGEALVFLSSEEENGQLLFSFKQMPSERRCVFTFPLYK